MATLEERIKASTRRGSAIAIQSNPIETGVSEKATLKIENLSDCRLITGPECEALLEKLKTCGYVVHACILLFYGVVQKQRSSLEHSRSRKSPLFVFFGLVGETSDLHDLSQDSIDNDIKHSS